MSTCNHAYHLECAGELGKYPKDVRCNHCDDKKNQSKKFHYFSIFGLIFPLGKIILAKLLKIKQPEIEELFVNRATRRELIELVDPLQEKFEKVKAKEDFHSRQNYNCHSMILGDSFFGTEQKIF
jgi:hypothetical protein